MGMYGRGDVWTGVCCSFGRMDVGLLLYLWWFDTFQRYGQLYQPGLGCMDGFLLPAGMCGQGVSFPLGRTDGCLLPAGRMDKGMLPTEDVWDVVCCPLDLGEQDLSRTGAVFVAGCGQSLSTKAFWRLSWRHVG